VSCLFSAGKGIGCDSATTGNGEEKATKIYRSEKSKREKLVTRDGELDNKRSRKRSDCVPLRPNKRGADPPEEVNTSLRHIKFRLNGKQT